VVLSVVATLLVVAAVVLVARDERGGDPPTAAPLDLDIAELEGALLTAADVGSGYTDSFDDGDDGDDELAPEDFDASPECLEAIDRFESTSAGDEGIDAGFESGDLTEVDHQIALVQEGDPGIAELQAALEDCESIAFDDGESQGEMRFQTEPVDGLGEAAVAVTTQVELTVDGVPVTAEIYSIYWSRGGVASSVAMSVLDSSLIGGTQDAELDRELVRELADTADQKLDGVLAG
jgi:hypothetical protein